MGSAAGGWMRRLLSGIGGLYRDAWRRTCEDYRMACDAAAGWEPPADGRDPYYHEKDSDAAVFHLTVEFPLQFAARLMDKDFWGADAYRNSMPGGRGLHVTPPMT